MKEYEFRLHRGATLNLRCVSRRRQGDPPKLEVQAPTNVSCAWHNPPILGTQTPRQTNTRTGQIPDFLAVVVVTIVIVIRIVLSVEIARLDDRELADPRVVLVHSLSRGPVIATHRHLPFPSRSFRES